MTMINWLGRSIVLLAIVRFSICSTSLYADNPEADIREALEQWRADFNARRAEHICDLFAPDLRYDFQGLPEQDYTQLCDRLHHALADHTKSVLYGVDMKGIIVSGPLAIVCLTWASTVTGSDERSVTDDEPGLDVFRREPDGRWQIIRYMAYPAHP